jgi:hypothetical protein
VAAIGVVGTVGGASAEDALRAVVDFARWPAMSEAVRSVAVEPGGDGESTSRWEVSFRDGLMRWSQRDVLDAQRGVAEFRLLGGDPVAWEGRWTAVPRGDGCVLTLAAEFDLGMPSLEHVLDPLALEALEDAVASVLVHLFGEDTEVEFTDTAARTQRGARA